MAIVLDEDLCNMMIDAIERGVRCARTQRDQRAQREQRSSRRELCSYIIQNAQHLSIDRKIALLRLIAKHAGEESLRDYNRGCMVCLGDIDIAILQRVRDTLAYYVSHPDI